jgi:parvulin-like peptidyl-prolyl isomerase
MVLPSKKAWRVTKILNEMSLQRKRSAFWTLPVLIASFAGCSGDRPKVDDNTLAVVGNRIIDKQDFIKRYQDFRRRTGQGVPDNGEVRRQVLQNYVDEELLIIEARERGFADDREGRHERERIEIQELLNAFNQKFIANRLTVSDDELQRLFVRLNTRIKARHLYAPTRQQADSLYTALQNGASFESLARVTFRDSRLRESGGLLGYFTVDEMEPAFEKAAYELKLGEISKPVRTNDGYSIIRVEDRLTKPLLTEYEYARHRDKLYSYWHRRKVEAATKAYVDSLRKAFNVSFNEPLVTKLFAQLKDRRQEDFLLESQSIPDDNDELSRQELVRSKLGVWNVAKLRQYAQFTSAQQHGWMRSEEDLKDFIAGLVVRSFILSKAGEARLNKQADYKEKVAEKHEIYLLKRMEETLRAEIEIPEDSLRSYYNEDPQRFAAPPEINLREIVLRDKHEADRVAAKLKKGIAFAALAKKHSVRRWSAEKGGELGYLTPRDLGKWATLAFSLKVGERVGPVPMDSMYVLLECLDKHPAKIPPFEDAREEVEKALRVMAWDKVRRKKVEEIRRTVPVKTFPGRLRTLGSS